MTNPFNELLLEFQAAYAEYGKELFFISAVTNKEWHDDREIIDEMAGCLGFVPLGEDEGGHTPGFYLFAPLYKNRWGRWIERWDEPYKCFINLAARAGAALPLARRRSVRFEPAEPVTWWLAFMWWLKPPDADTLTAPDGKRKMARVIWAEPFLDSMNAIESSGLVEAEQAGGVRDELNKLTDRQRNILQAMYENQVFDRESKLTTVEIAKKAEGRDAKTDNFKPSISDLSLRSIVQTLEGRGGGVWLTKKGHEMAESIISADKPST